MTPRMREILDERRAAFIKKFGREPGPNDPVFFYSEADVPRPIDLDKLEAATASVGREVSTV